MKKLSFLVFFGVLNVFLGIVALAPLPSYALEVQNLSVPGFGSIQKITTLGDVFYFLYGLTLLLAGVALFSSLFIFAIQYITSGANPGKRTEVRKRLAGAIGGAALLFGIFLFLKIINPELISPSNQTFQFCPPDGCPKVSFFSFSNSSGSSSSGSSNSTSGAACSAPASGNTCSPNGLIFSYFGALGVQDDAAKICVGEGDDPNALNSSCLQGGTCDYSVGLFQMNLMAHCPGAFNVTTNYQGDPNRCLCTIKDTKVLASCGDANGVTLSFDVNPGGEITHNEPDKQVKVAFNLWNGDGKNFCNDWRGSAVKCGFSC